MTPAIEFRVLGTPAPLVDAIARCITRHQIGSTEPVQPPAWITAAAQEITDAIDSQRHKYGTYRTNLGLCAIEDVEREIIRRAAP